MKGEIKSKRQKGKGQEDKGQRAKNKGQKTRAEINYLPLAYFALCFLPFASVLASAKLILQKIDAEMKVAVRAGNVEV